MKFATTLALSCLVLAFGAQAAHAQRGMVTGVDVVDESLTGADIKHDSIDSSEIKYGSLTDNDLGPDSVGASELKLNVKRVNQIVQANGPTSVTAQCPSGYTVLGGGGSVHPYMSYNEDKFALISSQPTWQSEGWEVRAAPIEYPEVRAPFDAHMHTGDGYGDIKWISPLVDIGDDQPFGIHVYAICAQL
jgi:hypothetical protein